MNKGDRVCLKVARYWSRETYLVDEVKGSFVNIGKPGNGRWVPSAKLRLAAEVETDRKRGQEARVAGKALNRVRALMQDGKEHSVAEIANLCELTDHAARCVLGRIRGIARITIDTFKYGPR